MLSISPRTIERKKTEQAQFDQSARAELILETVLQQQKKVDEDFFKLKQRADVETERKSGRLITHDSDRMKSRVLFITTNNAYLDKKSKEIDFMRTVSDLFDEIHIMVLTPLSGREESIRVTRTVWVYRASSQFWWLLPFAARRKVDEQLTFAGGFRADLIVGLDPFESGLAAYLIGRHFSRPFQIHVTENFYHDQFDTKQNGNHWRRFIARFILKRATSIRTATAQIHDQIAKRFPQTSDLAILPQFHNFSALTRSIPRYNIHDRYRDLRFIALAFGPLTADSHLHQIFSALNETLHNPGIGLVVIGKGPAKKLFEEKVRLLGISKNVVFAGEPTDIDEYFQTADLLIHTDTASASEEVVLKAAAAGLPMIMYATELRLDLFTDGESASIVEAGDVPGLEKNFKQFLNNAALRVQYRDAARAVVAARLDEDEFTYYRAFRDSVELALVSTAVDKAEDEETKNSQSLATISIGEEEFKLPNES